jgi:hypothetical protein
MNDFTLNLLKSEDSTIFSREDLGWEPDEVQSQLLYSTRRNIICNCHRQWGKSTCIAIKSLHHARYNPGDLVLIASPTENQSKELYRKIYAASNMVPGLERVEDSKSYMTLSNGSRIISLCGKESTVRGYSAPDIVIVDEASRALDELFIAVRPMLAMSKGQMILISTPHGKRGFFFHMWFEGGEEWERYEVKAPENPRIDPAWLERERLKLSDPMFRQEYLCEFVETEEQVYPYDLIQSSFSEDPEPFFGEAFTEDIKPFFEEHNG